MKFIEDSDEVVIIEDEEKEKKPKKQSKKSKPKKEKKSVKKEVKEKSKKATETEGEIDITSIITHITKSREKGKILQTYEIKVDLIKVKVNIIESKPMNLYELELPKISEITKTLMQDIKARLIKEVKLSAEQILDPHQVTKIKKTYMEKALSMLKSRMHLSKETLNLIVTYLINEMIGLGNLEFLIADPELEEIVVVCATEPVRVYHKRFGWLETNLRLENEEQILNYASIIARRVGRQVTTLNPLLDAYLVTGDRANAVLYPINTKGNSITIRKFAREPWTFTELIKNKTATTELFALLWQAIEYESNILIAGGTASGKTTLLNVLLSFMPPQHRLISIEDTRELQLPEYLYWTPLVTRQANPEGKGEVTMLDLLVNSLRMRPDRIILGEIRRAREAEVLFEAMHTGHSVYATIHANTVAETIKRLTMPPINLPASLLRAVDLVVVMFRDRRKGIRRVLQLGEIVEAESRVDSNILYRYDPVNDTINKHADSLRYFEDLSRNTGMSMAEIKKDIELRQSILKWALKQELSKLADISKLMKAYYSNKNLLLGIINSNQDFNTLIKKFTLQ